MRAVVVAGPCRLAVENVPDPCKVLVLPGS